jgi:cytochrome c-type biogenesis protein CcmH/NrfF
MTLLLWTRYAFLIVLAVTVVLLVWAERRSDE